MDRHDDLSEVEGEASAELVSIVESLVFAAPKPLRVRDLHRVIPESSIRQIQLALKHLIHARDESGIRWDRISRRAS